MFDRDIEGCLMIDVAFSSTTFSTSKKFSTLRGSKISYKILGEFSFFFPPLLLPSFNLEEPFIKKLFYQSKSI